MRVRPNSFLLIFLLAASLSTFGQAGHYWYQTDLQRNIERSQVADNERDHLAIKPLSLRDLKTSELAYDSTSLGDGWGARFWSPPDSNRWAVNFSPLLTIEVGAEANEKPYFSLAPGLAMNIRYGQKFAFYADFVGGAYQGPEYIDDFMHRSGVIPSLGENKADKGTPAFILPTARLSYAPSQYFQFELGYGRNFFGQGYRSMLLSDVAYNYPYLKIETDVWNIKYVNLYSMLKGTSPGETNPTSFKTKYTTSHYLSWAVSPRFNVGFFETIVWQDEDSLSDRGFDPNYLNPVIFYRTVEYSLGSPDNALMGLDLSFKATKRLLIYGQLILDEFLLKEIRDRSGWWANKWGTQLGVKSFDSFGVKNLFIQAEFNVARPFTYTHGSVLQNFGHYNQPLAHQLGTNFYEGYLSGYYERGDWYGELSFLYATYGRDPDTLNLGGDIFKSYENPSKQYDNTIGQGIGTKLYYQKFSLGFILNRNMNLRVGIDYTLRNQNTAGQPNQTTHLLGFRLSTNLSNAYRDF